MLRCEFLLMTFMKFLVMECVISGLAICHSITFWWSVCYVMAIKYFCVAFFLSMISNEMKQKNDLAHLEFVFLKFYLCITVMWQTS
jgi:hypothetical protein